MEKKERNINLYSSVMLPLGLAALVWSIYGFPLEKVNGGLIVLSLITVFFSSYLRIQLPRTKIHLTISDTLIILSLLLYGGKIAVLLAALESCFTSLHFRRQGINIKAKTIGFNVAIAAISVFITSQVDGLIFGSPETIVETGNNVYLIALLITMALSLFIVNSICVSIFIALRTEKTLWQVWNEYCLNALVMYLTGAALAGVTASSLHQSNLFMIVVVIVFFALVYMTYRRYVDDVKETAAKAEQAERERAEQAENHVKELQHYVAELEKSSYALRDSREKFRHAAYHDALTQLPNRNHFTDTLKFLLEKTRHNPDFNFAVLFLDLNRFKTINDSLGHPVGDRLIMNVARRLSNMMREKDLVGRFSGDEFAIILDDVKSLKEATDFAEKVAKRLSEPFTLSGRQVFTSVSIGIAVGNPNYKEAQDILRDADIAMYYAKERKEDFVIFDKKMHARAVTLLQLETDLRYAVERDEFCLYYQPIVGIDEVKLIGFEALIRWNHPKRGLVPPGEFIPVCEDTGLIIPMTWWILRSACRQIVEWQERSPEHQSLMVSVNFSGKHFADPGLVSQVKAILLETRINPACLKLEITESAVMENAETAISMLKQIRELGVQISIDDFGTGYSSLSYLHRFPINTLKIDRSFVSTMEDGSENGEIVRTIIALAKTLNLNVIAEGIETIHQLHQLKILGCEMGQGYLFSRAVSVQEVAKLLEDKTRWQNLLPNQNFGLISQNPEYSHLILSK